mgnify:FL=1|tara:strand:+ start:481 stop:882 length:402 start_codon:yes stop_codon:yes gene_type:complete
MTKRYIYTDGTESMLMDFDDLGLTTEDDGSGVRVPHEMNEEQFLTYLADQDDEMVQYWFANDHSPSGWYTGDIELYDENHRHWPYACDHEKYFGPVEDDEGYGEEDPKELEREWRQAQVESWGNFIDISGPPH